MKFSLHSHNNSPASFALTLRNDKRILNLRITKFNASNNIIVISLLSVVSIASGPTEQKRQIVVCLVHKLSKL